MATLKLTTLPCIRSHKPHHPFATLFIILATFAATTAARSEIRVDVNSQFRTQYDEDVKIEVNRIYTTPLGLLNSGDVVTIAIATPGRPGASYHIDVMPIERANSFQSELERLLPYHNGEPARTWTIKQPGNYVFLIRDDRYFIFGSDDVHLNIVTSGHYTDEFRKSVVARLLGMAQKIDSMFALNTFVIRVQPCNYVNAFYDPNTGDIFFCTELLPSTFGQMGAFEGVLFHELGHKLLHDLNQPNWNGEVVADNFAIWMLLQYPGGIGMTANFSGEFQNNNPWVEATNIIGSQGQEPHPLGIQRYRNIQDTLAAPEQFMERWNNYLYQFMTADYLKRIVQQTKNFESKDVAQAILAYR
jgi:hypothetical protein